MLNIVIFRILQLLCFAAMLFALLSEGESPDGLRKAVLMRGRN